MDIIVDHHCRGFVAGTDAIGQLQGELTIRGNFTGFYTKLIFNAINNHPGVLKITGQALADRFWPGPITLVLAGGEARLPDVLRGPEDGIAVRWTSQRDTASLIGELGEPISSTSANKPGKATAPGVGALVEMFKDSVAKSELMVLDGGVLGNVPPSTLIDCTGPRARLIREGAVPLSEIRAGIGRLAP